MVVSIPIGFSNPLQREEGNRPFYVLDVSIPIGFSNPLQHKNGIAGATSNV